MTSSPPEEPEAAKDKSELIAAYQAVVGQSGEQAVRRASLPPKQRGTPKWVTALAALAWAGLLYIWIARPAALFSPDLTITLTPAEREAQLRLGLFLSHERVARYRAEHGRLPGSLEEAGDVEEGVSYAPTGDSSFVLTGSDDGVTLRLESGADPASILTEAQRAPGSR